MTHFSGFRISVLLLALVQVLSAQQNQNTTTQVGDLLFTMPAGWTQLQNGAGITAPPTEVGKVTLIMFSATPLQGDLKAAYQQQLAEMQKTANVQPISEPAIQQMQGGFPALMVPGVLTEPNGLQFVMLYVLAQNGTKGESLLFVTNDTDQNMMTLHKAALTIILTTLRFSGSQAASPGEVMARGGTSGAANSLMPSTPNATLRGASNPAFMAASGGSSRDAMPAMGLSTTPGGPPRFTGILRAAARNGEDPTANLAIGDPAGNSPGYKFLVFFDDGRVKRGLIHQGFGETFAEPSMRHDIASGGKFAMQWGIYQFGGGSGRIQFASAIGGQQLVSGLRGEIWNVVEYPDHLVVNGETYLQLPCPPGLKLSGTFKPFGDVNQRGITFTPDGQFIDEGIFDTGTSMAVGMVGGGIGMAYGFSSPKAGRGVYNVSNYGLNLRYASSVNPVPVFFIEPESSPNDVRTIYISNVKYQRVQ